MRGRINFSGGGGDPWLYTLLSRKSEVTLKQARTFVESTHVQTKASETTGRRGGVKWS